MEPKEIEQKINNDLIWINQSKIKRVTKTVLCPQRYYLEEITGEVQRYSSEAMNYGNYFEYHTTGQLPREGNVPVIAQLKKPRLGSTVPAAQQRIDLQVKKFHEVMEQHGIKIIKTGYELKYNFDHDIIIFGTLDCLVDYKGKPYIMDIKLTQDVTNTFGDFSWGQFIEMHPDKNGVYVARFVKNGEGMDLIQSFAYPYLMEKKTRTPWGFLYAVFDYKKNPEHKIIEVMPSEEGRQDMIDRLSGTKHKLKVFKELNYKAIPSLEECKGCKAENCTVRMDASSLLEPEPSEPIETILVQAIDYENSKNERPW